MNLSIYSDKSFVINGNTKEHKDTLKELGGKWNSKLTCGSGWIFSLSKKKEIEEWLEKIQKTTSPLPPTTAAILPKQIVSENTSFETLLNEFVVYLQPIYNNQNNKLFDILFEFHYLKKTENDDFDNYFIDDNKKLYHHLFLFLKTKKNFLTHTLYQQLDKNKLIEHALIRLL